jgi:crossover junction endodeoxyribonuclease RuvC
MEERASIRQAFPAVLPADLVPADCQWPIVLGIDPGTRAMGYGALVVAPDGPRLVACGVLRPRARDAIAWRLAHLQEELEGLLASLRPSALALEGAFHAKNVRAALRLGEARGVVLATAARRGIPVHEFAPAAAKKAVLGHGGASKTQVARMVAILLGSEPLDVPSDATDALALAFAAVKRDATPGSQGSASISQTPRTLARHAPGPSNGGHGDAVEARGRAGRRAGRRTSDG